MVAGICNLSTGEVQTDGSVGLTGLQGYCDHQIKDWAMALCYASPKPHVMRVVTVDPCNAIQRQRWGNPWSRLPRQASPFFRLWA